MPTRNSKIINVADDFGISRIANQNILKLVKKKKVDRVSVLMNSQAGNLPPKEIEELVKSGVKIDIHLDYPIFLVKKERKLREGSVLRIMNFCGGYLVGRGSSQKVRQEWESQINKFMEHFGRVPDGINSHQYIHLFPAYFKITVDLAKKFQIPYVRYGKTGLIKGNGLIYKILKGLRKVTEKEFRDNGCQSSDFLVSLDWIRNWNHFLKALPAGTTEIVCHPERNEEFRAMMKNF